MFHPSPALLISPPRAACSRSLVSSTPPPCWRTPWWSWAAGPERRTTATSCPSTRSTATPGYSLVLLSLVNVHPYTNSDAHMNMKWRMTKSFMQHLDPLEQFLKLHTEWTEGILWVGISRHNPTPTLHVWYTLTVELYNINGPFILKMREREVRMGGSDLLLFIFWISNWQMKLAECTNEHIT